MIMKKEELNIKGSDLLVPFLVGGVVGAGIALLVAPKSGKEIRKDIKDFGVQTKDTIANTIDESKKMYERGKSAVVNAIDAGKTAFRQREERHFKAA